MEGDLKAQLVCHALQCALYTKPTPPDRANVHALVVEELRRLHEGVLARYGLRPSHLAAWRKGKGG